MTAACRRTVWLASALAALAIALSAPASGEAAAPRASLTTVERQVMCVTCKIPLNVAESTQANRERAFIRELIAEGDDEAQIKNALVAQYGPAVLGLPQTHGFDLTVYIVPAAVVAALVVLVGLLLPRWRRRARAQHPPSGRRAGLDPGDSARLDADMARFD
jgi:cytochrome c-type biogenesis protein CcmH